MEAAQEEGMIRTPNCFKSRADRCIDLMLTNMKFHFFASQTFETGFSDFHHMIYTILKTIFQTASFRSCLVQKLNTNLRHDLTGFVASSILKLTTRKIRGLWSSVQQNTPRNTFNFMIKYSNNTLPTKKNLHKWSLSDFPSCSFCLNPETLQHVVSSCNSYLANGRYTWRHNYVLLLLARSFSSLQTALYTLISHFSHHFL